MAPCMPAGEVQWRCRGYTRVDTEEIARLQGLREADAALGPERAVAGEAKLRERWSRVVAQGLAKHPGRVGAQQVREQRPAPHRASQSQHAQLGVVQGEGRREFLHAHIGDAAAQPELTQSSRLGEGGRKRRGPGHFSGYMPPYFHPYPPVTNRLSTRCHNSGSTAESTTRSSLEAARQVGGGGRGAGAADIPRATGLPTARHPGGVFAVSVFPNSVWCLARTYCCT